MLLCDHEAAWPADSSSDATTSTWRRTPSRSPSPTWSASGSLKPRPVKVALLHHAAEKVDPNRVNCIEYGKILAAEHSLLLLTPSMSHHQAVDKILVAMNGRGIYDEEKPGVHFDSLEMIVGCESILLQVVNWEAAVMLLLSNEAATLTYRVAIARPDWEWTREVRRERKRARKRRKLGTKSSQPTAVSARVRGTSTIAMIALVFWLLGTGLIFMVVFQ